MRNATSFNRKERKERKEKTSRLFSKQNLLFAFFAVALGLSLADTCLAEEAGQPFVRLYDTGSLSSLSLPVAAVAAKAGWVQVPADDMAHKFKGDLVLGNDRLTVVITHAGGIALVYTPVGGPKRLTTLLPRAADGAVQRTKVFRIIENTSGAVAVEITSTGPATVTFRLAVGQPYVEVRPGAGMVELWVWADSRLIVVPDFFGDDMVFTSDRIGRAGIRLPAENFVLGLSGTGDSMTMCVWQCRGTGVRAEVWMNSGSRSFLGWQIDCVEGKSIWVAFLEGEGLWHERSVPTADAGKALDWKPPFPAKWRADRIGKQDLAQSVPFESLPMLQGGNYIVYPIDRTKATPLMEFTPVDILRNTLGIGPCQYILETEGLASADNPTPDNVMTWVEKQVKKKGGKDAADDIRERLKAMVELAGRTQARIKR